MSQFVMVADLGDKVVVTDAPVHPEPRPIPGAVAEPQSRFLDDLARSLDDLTIDTRP